MASDSGAAAAHPDRTGTPDPAVEQMLRDAGFEVTEEGRARWRARLATPIPATALAEGRRIRAGARGRSAA